MAPTEKPVRRRASRPAGPTSDVPAQAVVRIAVADSAVVKSAPKTREVGPPPRRRPNRRMVAVVALVFGFVMAGGLSAAVVVLGAQRQDAQALQARNQRFVDTATQTVVNMFSFKQDTIDESVDRFYESTSGPLRDMFSQTNNVENLKAIFRDTGGSSETVINGAAIESTDDISNTAAVLVSARVTASDMNGNNRPSQPYRLRIIVKEGDDGRMTAYDLNYPNGGN
ncbi:MAG: mammalian cell entry protein [Mycobacterium sp.]